jgi:hypothetical protein
MTEKEQLEFRRLIAKRKGATGTVTNSAQPTASAAAVAVKARLDAAKASLAAAEARAHAKATAAALKPDPLAGQSDSQLQFVASHRSASPADAQAAKTALESRGWTVHPNGAFSQSTVKQPRR